MDTIIEEGRPIRRYKARSVLVSVTFISKTPSYTASFGETRMIVLILLKLITQSPLGAVSIEFA